MRPALLVTISVRMDVVRYKAASTSQGLPFARPTHLRCNKFGCARYLHGLSNTEGGNDDQQDLCVDASQCLGWGDTAGNEQDRGCNNGCLEHADPTK